MNDDDEISLRSSLIEDEPSPGIINEPQIATERQRIQQIFYKSDIEQTGNITQNGSQQKMNIQILPNIEINKQMLEKSCASDDNYQDLINLPKVLKSNDSRGSDKKLVEKSLLQAHQNSDSKIDDTMNYEIIEEDINDEEAQSRKIPMIFKNNSRDDVGQHKYKEKLNNLRGYQGYISRQLLALGYDENQILVLIQNYPYAQSLEEAVDYLTFDANGWTHPFITQSQGLFSQKVCILCSEEKQTHSERQGMNFNPIRENEAFPDSFTCGICYMNIEDEELVLLRCQHAYCLTCLKEFVNFQVNNGQIKKLICPHSDCQIEINLKYLQKHVMDDDTYSKYFKFSNRQEIHRNPRMKGCPTPDCEGYLEKPHISSETQVICDTCKKCYCFNCLHTPHPSETCEQKIAKDYEEWATMTGNDVGLCKNCGIKIEKEGGCPNMICKICKHEWCWTCKEDFPVHTPECSNYQFYLEILEFQGLNNNDTDTWGWYNLGTRHGFTFWLCQLLLLLILGLPLLLLVNVALTPVYLLIMIQTCCSINKQKFKTWWGVIITIFAFLLLYVGIPVIFFILTMPQIVIFTCKIFKELGMLMKNRCRYYRGHSVSPIMNKYFLRIGLD
ncbi:ibr domain containing protein [Stylonychia lemnae]|uniref:RBR-type E3 ubiquitin transferase n=1 Tax=Stylonychia lemnae TaxID=5949 RepID=A0A077ZZ31_STYLE|nr:ibr domain containing protein [Stylonychia lemnae]|eukprot:CDW75180.1 ibr domain containing protein [Stylonychia lemnae]